MTASHLLPRNASLFEQEMSKATDSLARLGSPADGLRAFKTDPDDFLLPWLLWEYGLSELLPYLPEPRQAIRDGLRWQRLRGTPAALATALSWVGATATVEQEPPGIHFAEFQLNPGKVLDSDEAIAHLIALARLSAPARSRLSRITHGFDRRRFVLDESALGGALLSDHSGVFWRDGQTRLSFGRGHAWPFAGVDSRAMGQCDVARFGTARLLDRMLLDFAGLGDPGHTQNEEILHSHLFTLANDDALPHPRGLLPERRYCRAMVVLSDGPALGDTQANLPRYVLKEEGHSLRLGVGDALSATPHRFVRVEVLERRDQSHPSALQLAAPRWILDRQVQRTQQVHARADQALGHYRLGSEAPSFDEGALGRAHTRRNDPLPDAAGWRARRYCQAMVTLSAATLGDTNANLPGWQWAEEGESLALGGGQSLSGTPHRLTRAAVLERFEAHYPAALAVPSPTWNARRHALITQPVMARAQANLGAFQLGELRLSFDQGALQRLHERGNEPLPEAAGWQDRRYCQAMVVLSDGPPLGDTNANLPSYLTQEIGQGLTLGGGEGLSDTVHRIIAVEVLARVDALHPGSVQVPPVKGDSGRARCSTGRIAARADLGLGNFALGGSKPGFDQGGLARQHTRRNDPLPEAAGWRAQHFQRAQIVLSEAVLGDINTRTPRVALFRRLPTPVLGSCRLGEIAEIERRALTEMHTRLAGCEAADGQIDISSPGCREQVVAISVTDDPLTTSCRNPHRSTSVGWQGQTWAGTRWPATAWKALREVVASTHIRTGERVS